MKVKHQVHERGAAPISQHPRKRSYAGPDAEPADDAEMARLEALVDAGNAREVRAAARLLLQHLRLRTWLHLRLVDAIRLADAQDRAEIRNAPMTKP